MAEALGLPRGRAREVARRQLIATLKAAEGEGT